MHHLMGGKKDKLLVKIMLLKISLLISKSVILNINGKHLILKIFLKLINILLKIKMLEEEELEPVLILNFSVELFVIFILMRITKRKHWR